MTRISRVDQLLCYALHQGGQRMAHHLARGTAQHVGTAPNHHTHNKWVGEVGQLNKDEAHL